MSLGGDRTHGLVSGTADDRGTLRFRDSGPDRAGERDSVVSARGDSTRILAACRGGGAARPERNAALCERLSGGARAHWARRNSTTRRRICKSATSRALSRFGAIWRTCGSTAGRWTKPRFRRLLQPGKQFVQPPNRDKWPARQQRRSDADSGRPAILGALQQPAFLVVRLEAGPLPMQRKIRRREGAGSRCADSARRRSTSWRSVSSRSRSGRRESACTWACAAIAAARWLRSARRRP